jgi:hypothetical protein
MPPASVTFTLTLIRRVKKIPHSKIHKAHGELFRLKSQSQDVTNSRPKLELDKKHPKFHGAIQHQ